MFRYISILVSAIIALPLGADWLSFGSITPKAPEVNVLSSSSYQLDIEFKVPGVEYLPVKTEKGEFVKLVLGKYGYTTELGRPEIPVIREFIEVPEGANVEVKLVDAVTGHVYLTEWILPVQPSRPKTGEPVEFTIDEEAYSSDEFYPEFDVKVIDAGVVRGHHLMALEIYPMSYNPKTGELRYIAQGRVEIKFKGGNVAGTKSDISLHYALPFEHKLAKLILNYGAFEEKPALELPLGYLIITPDEWVSTLTPFIEWKKLQGYKVQVATLSQTGSSTTDIKNYIQSVYDDPTFNLTFIQLVGDVEQIPNWTGQASDNPATDLYYSTLEGDDYFPDVYVGRLSAQDESQLSTIVNKIVRYESVDNWVNGTDWAGIAYFMASDDGGHHQVAEGTHQYCMRIVERYGMVTDSMWEYYHSGTPPVQAINEGRSMSIYSGHGSTSGWAGPSMSISDVYNLNNVDMLTHVESYACLTGQYTQSECFMEAWLRAPNGAITAMGSSVTSYWDEDDILQRRIFDEWFDSTYYWVMGNINEGKYELWRHYGGAGRSRRYYEMYNLFGDPSTDIFTLPPVTPLVNVPGAIPIAPSQVPVYVSREGQPVQYALVTFMQDDSIIGQGYTDESGNALVQVAPLSGGDVTLSIIGHNLVPYIDTIVAISEGAYVGLLSYQIDDSGGNSNGNFDAGETINLDVLAKNYGNQNANDVYGILTSDDPFVQIVQDSVSFGLIGAGDSVWGANPYVITALPTTPDEHDAMFSIEFHDANDSVWISHFALRIYSPNVQYVMHTITDTLNGNGNGVSEPGETVELFVTLGNIGHSDINNVTASINTQADYLNILVDTASYGDIPAGGSSTSNTPYVIQISDSAPAPVFPEIVLSIDGEGGFHFVDTFQLIIGRTGLFCMVEGDTAGWTHGGSNDLWHVSTRSYHSASHSFYSGNESSGQYTDNMDAWLMTPVVVLGPNASLQFWHKYELESNWDFGYVEISTDGNSWTELLSITGTQDEWTREVIDLSDYSGNAVYLRFRQTSDVSVAYEGWYIDDIAVTPPELPAALALSDVEVVNEFNRLEPGYPAIIVPSLQNIGGTPALNVMATLSTSSEYITITDNQAAFGNIDPEQTVAAIDSFTVEVSSDAPIGTPADFTMFVTANDGSYVDTLAFTLTIGDPRLAPTGPDGYGYYIYDMFDTNGPEFNWVDASSGTQLSLGDDDTRTISLPFTFRYYGQDYTQISICSNGWIALGTETSTNYSNTSMPNSDEPNNTVAALWDDLNPSDGGAVRYLYDETQNIFVVEYNDVPHYGSSETETFEVIFYDPNYYPTPTGDGIIVINYLTAPQQDDFTVGFENADGSDGLQYYYDGDYDVHANEITDSFALKITTETPPSVAEHEGGEPRRPLKFALYPAAPNPMLNQTVITFSIPKAQKVSLKVYDASGRMVASLVDGELNAGVHQVKWNGADRFGHKLSAGVYFYKLQAGSKVATRKLVILK